MMKSYYHATPYENLVHIVHKGLIRGYDGVIYLTEDPVDSMKFLVVRGYTDLLVVKVELDESEVEESFDHSSLFFECKAYMYPHDIPVDDIDLGELQRYELTKRRDSNGSKS